MFFGPSSQEMNNFSFLATLPFKWVVRYNPWLPYRKKHYFPIWLNRIVFIANAVYKNNILKLCGYTLFDLLSNMKLVFHNTLTIQNSYWLIFFFSFHVLQKLSLLVLVPDLHIIGTLNTLHSASKSKCSFRWFLPFQPIK